MPPHAQGCSGDRQRHEAGHGGELLQGPGQRSASFHGRGAEQRHQLPKQRPKTQPDLLAGLRGRSFRAADGVPVPAPAAARKTPSKVLVSVAVLRSMWPLHVMASAEWSVADLVAAGVALYVKEGRRPLLPSSDPAAFGLHFSQFCLESLDPREKVMELGPGASSCVPGLPPPPPTPPRLPAPPPEQAGPGTKARHPRRQASHQLGCSTCRSGRPCSAPARHRP